MSLCKGFFVPVEAGLVVVGAGVVRREEALFTRTAVDDCLTQNVLKSFTYVVLN